MPKLATLRERRLRMTKAQLIDEIDTLEQRAAATPEGGYVSILTDITARKRAEEALAEKGLSYGKRQIDFVASSRCPSRVTSGPPAPCPFTSAFRG